MTVSSLAIAPRKLLFPNISGSTGPFSFDFRILIRNGVPQIGLTKYQDDGTPVALNYPADYSFVAQNFGLSGGTITLSVAGSTGESLLVYGLTPDDQPTRYTNLGDFFPEKHEESYDQQAMLIQEQKQDIARAIKLDLAVSSPAPTLEDITGGDGQAIVIDEPNNRLVKGPTASDITQAQSYAAAALAQAQAAAMSAADAAASAASALAAATGMKYRATRAGSTANVNIASAPSAIDGVTLNINDRVLLKNQTAPAENGIYVFNGASSAMTRAADMDTWAEVPGTVVVVTEGSVNADTVWLCTSNDGGTLGTTAVTFVDWAAVIINGSITNAKLANMAANTVKVNATAGSAAPSDIALGTNNILARASGNIVAATISQILDFISGSIAHGDIAYRGASTWARLPAGTNGQFLRTGGAGAAPAWADVPLSGMTLIDVKSGAASSYDFTTGIDSTYDDYLFVLDNIILSANNLDLLMRIGNGSFTASNYSMTYVQQLSSTQTPGSSADGATSYLLSSNIATNGDNGYIHGHVWGYGYGSLAMNQTITEWSCNRKQMDNVTGGNNVIRTSRGAGTQRTVGSVVNRVQFLPSGGTISGGNVRMYGLKKS